MSQDVQFEDSQDENSAYATVAVFVAGIAMLFFDQDMDRATRFVKEAVKKIKCPCNDGQDGKKEE